MRKGWIILLAAVMAVAFALPAAADLTPKNLKVSGFYRAKAWLSNFHDGGGGPSLRDSDTEQTNAYVEQRARMKLAFGTENVQAVWFFESDMLWGDSAATVGRNQGGGVGADSIQLETKNLYLWFKIPDTSIDVTVGLQAYGDAYAGLFSSAGGNDGTGITVKGKLEPVSFRIAYEKLAGDLSSQTQLCDDVNLYIAEVKFAPSKESAITANLYYLQDDSGRDGDGLFNPLDDAAYGDNRKLDLYMPGVNVVFNTGIAKISGYAFYQFGTLKSTTGAADIDVRAYGVDVRGDIKLGPGSLFVEGLFLSGGDNPNDKYEAPVTLGDYQGFGPGGLSGFSRTRMQILLPSWDTINVSQCLIGCSGGEYGDSPGNAGRGIWHVAAGYSAKVTSKIKLEANIGYLSATELYATGDEFRDKDFGTEFNVGMHYNIAKGLDFGLFAAYVALGDFVKDPPPAANFEDPWTSYARINYSF